MTPEQLMDTRPNWLANVQAEDTEAEVWTTEGHTHTYTVTRTGLEPELTWTVGNPPDNTDHFHISVNVPETDREHWITHEVREFTALTHLPERERCPAAMTAELADIRKQMPHRLGRYIALRLELFEQLVTYYETGGGAKSPRGRNEDFKAGLRASRAILDDEMFTLLTE